MGKSPLIEQLRACAAAARNHAIQLALETIESVSIDLEAVEGKKADKPKAVFCVITPSGWKNDKAEKYPHYYDIAVSGATVKDRAEVTLAASSLEAASDCGLCQTCETMDGKLRLRAVSAPTADLSVEYWIEQGKE